MRISRKYPAFLVLTTMLTGFGVTYVLVNVLSSSMEREITKRGEATVESFAMMNAPLLLTGPSERAKSRLQFNLGSMAKNPDVVDARLADTQGTIIASLHEIEIGTKLPVAFTDPNGETTYVDPVAKVYHFRANVRYGSDVLGYFVLSLSRRPLETAVTRARNRAFIFASGIAAAIAIFAVLAVQREIRPLKMMSVALSEIAKGDFSQRVPEERRDEIGELSAAFNRMLQRSELLFHYVDKMVIERLVADASLTNPGGRERDLAVIFGDMRGYTAMSNRRNADEVVHIVNTYFHLFIECVAHLGGVVDKTMGDAIMAVFERHDNEDVDGHKRRGVLALAYMKASSRVLNRFLLQRRATVQTLEMPVEPREFGFAMATGRAIVGNIGSKRRMDYTVCGRIVNLASRLEGLTKHGEVIIDNFTLFGVSDLIKTEALEPVQPKGFSADEKVTPHRIIGLSDQEAHKLRIFLKKLFVFSFLRDMIMPRDLPVGEQQPWCQEAELQLIRIVAETPMTDFFARADVESARLLHEQDSRIGPPDRRSRRPTQPPPSDTVT
ncbi:MAG: adenylate/guanylate cyclase domain-containing protein [Myxococcota bacterium]